MSNGAPGESVAKLRARAREAGLAYRYMDGTGAAVAIPAEVLRARLAYIPEGGHPRTWQLQDGAARADAAPSAEELAEARDWQIEPEVPPVPASMLRAPLPAEDAAEPEAESEPPCKFCQSREHSEDDCPFGDEDSEAEQEQNHEPHGAWSAAAKAAIIANDPASGHRRPSAGHRVLELPGGRRVAVREEREVSEVMDELGRALAALAQRGARLDEAELVELIDARIENALERWADTLHSAIVDSLRDRSRA